KNGARANTSNLEVVVSFKIDGGACNSYLFPRTPVVNGFLRIQTTGALLSPPIPSSPGSLLVPCSGFPVYVGHPASGHLTAVDAIPLGSWPSPALSHAVKDGSSRSAHRVGRD